jgi:hypothetical protein
VSHSLSCSYSSGETIWRTRDGGRACISESRAALRCITFYQPHVALWVRQGIGPGSGPLNPARRAQGSGLPARAPHVIVTSGTPRRQRPEAFSLAPIAAARRGEPYHHDGFRAMSIKPEGSADAGTRKSTSQARPASQLQASAQYQIQCARKYRSPVSFGEQRPIQ